MYIYRERYVYSSLCPDLCYVYVFVLALVDNDIHFL